MEKPYYPWWLDNLADDVTGEGAFMEGAAHGAEAVRSIATYAREVYEHQEFNFAGDYADNGYLEEYTTRVRGQPTGVVVAVTRNAAGEAQHLVVNHRPRSSVCSSPACAARSSPAPPLPSSSTAARPETDVLTTASTDVQPSALLLAAGAPLRDGERPHEACRGWPTWQRTPRPPGNCRTPAARG